MADREEPTEQAIVRRYKRETLTAAQQESVRAHLLAHVEVESQVARRESERHKRRLRDLTAQQQKRVQLYYDGGVSKEMLQAEQQRIEEDARPGQTVGRRRRSRGRGRGAGAR